MSAAKFQIQGREVYAYTGGKRFDASLPCVVFIHGALNDHSVWTLLARYFAHHGRSVLAVDLPGHGRSAGPALDSVEALGDWLNELLDAAGVKGVKGVKGVNGVNGDGAVSLVGHSMGSLIALAAAARRPARVATLAMVGTAWPMKVSDALLSTSRERPRAAMAMVNAFSHSTTAGKPSYPGPGAWMHGGNLALMERMQDGYAAHGNLFEHDFLVCDRYQGAMEAVAQVTAAGTVRTHLILGAKDAMTPPKAAKQLADGLKATVRTLPAGHSLMTEAPEGMLNALKAALG